MSLKNMNEIDGEKSDPFMMNKSPVAFAKA